MQDPESQHVGQQASDRNHHHRHPGDRLRMLEALNGLPDNQHGDHHQSNGIEKRRQGGQTQPAKSMAGVRGTAGEANRQQRKQQGGGVGEHMAGIRQQGQRAGDRAADGFYQHKTGGDDERPKQPASVAVIRSLGRGVRMRMRHGVVP